MLLYPSLPESHQPLPLAIHLTGGDFKKPHIFFPGAPICLTEQGKTLRSDPNQENSNLTGGSQIHIKSYI
ncbi:hypothetical protein CEXT_188421 [Caerostris extrusa]|uniref:Uncharacterized protein n=1 Tax=Caerostris extrusa TaxID=172846 RepID=A0AAV4WGF1_CAEEX|nr:hypothetical protein CEXT_188421 [Caerostris extrusa]